MMPLLTLVVFSCENHDSLMAFVYLEGKMEKIDTVCGSNLPKPIMSNGPRLNVEFHSIQAAKYVRGFKATYSFTEGRCARFSSYVISDHLLLP